MSTEVWHLCAKTERVEVERQLRFAVAFPETALSGGPSVKEIVAKGKFTFPPFQWSRDEYLGWNATKHPKERGIKRRELLQAVG